MTLDEICRLAAFVLLIGLVIGEMKLVEWRILWDAKKGRKS